MPLLPFRLHSLTCSFRARGRAYNRCKCPVWVDGYLDTKRVKRSLKTRNWQKAQKLCLDWEQVGKQPTLSAAQAPNTVYESTQRFEAEMIARKLRPGTQKKYRTLFRQLNTFCTSMGIRELSQFTLSLTEQFRQTWVDSAVSSSKKLERLRAFMGWAKNHQLLPENFAKLLRQPIQKQPPTMPFTVTEMRNILAACDSHHNQPLKALVLLLRYSGLRIGDGASLHVMRLDGRKLFLYTAKGGTPVYTKLPQFVIDELNRVARVSANHWFWTGHGSKETLSGNWRRSFRKAMKAAGIEGAHAHRFRDTFAVELLQRGVGMEDVSKLLGHTSIKVTEKHYAPWVRGRQERLESILDAALENDELAGPSTNSHPASGTDLVSNPKPFIVNLRKQTG